jgi:hypothetical protein
MVAGDCGESTVEHSGLTRLILRSAGYDTMDATSQTPSRRYRHRVSCQGIWPRPLFLSVARCMGGQMGPILALHQLNFWVKKKEETL